MPILPRLKDHKERRQTPLQQRVICKIQQRAEPQLKQYRPLHQKPHQEALQKLARPFLAGFRVVVKNLETSLTSLERGSITVVGLLAGSFGDEGA